jgi:hypothetical protein
VLAHPHVNDAVRQGETAGLSSRERTERYVDAKKPTRQMTATAANAPAR